MEKWKIFVIIGLVAALPLYGYLQSREGKSRVIETDLSATPTPPPPVKELIGKPAIPWNIPTDGWANTPKPISLKDVNGSVTLLEFWRAECGHCQQAAPFMQQLFTTYGPKGLKMIGVQAPNVKKPQSIEHNWKQVTALAKSWGVTYPIAFDKGATLFTQYKCTKWPAFFILDRKGTVVYADQGHTEEKSQQLIQALEKELGIESSATPPKGAAVPRRKAAL